MDGPSLPLPNPPGGLQYSRYIVGLATSFCFSSHKSRDVKPLDRLGNRVAELLLVCGAELVYKLLILCRLRKLYVCDFLAEIRGVTSLYFSAYVQFSPWTDNPCRW